MSNKNISCEVWNGPGWLTRTEMLRIQDRFIDNYIRKYVFNTAIWKLKKKKNCLFNVYFVFTFKSTKKNSRFVKLPFFTLSRKNY